MALIWEPIEFVPRRGRLCWDGPMLFTPEPTVQDTVEAERLATYFDEVEPEEEP